MAIPIIGTYQGASINQAPGILTNVLGLPSSEGTCYSTNISWDWAIQLGSGTQNFSLTLTGLAAPILNGTGTGELAYGSLSVSYVGSTILISLQVSNTTSSAISVTEIGLTGTIYIQYCNGGISKYNFLFSYDTFSTAISVPALGMAIFQITLSFTG